MNATDRTPCLPCRLALVLAVGLLTPLAALAQEAAGQKVISEVQVVGNQRITTAQVKGLIQATRVGMPYNPGLVAQDVRRLVDSHWFRNVKPIEKPTDDGRVIIIFEVYELPNDIQEIRYEGARWIKLSDLEELTGLKKGIKLNPTVNQNARMAILRKYQEKGYYWASVELVEGGKPSDSRVIFRITEGPPVRVSGFSFSGIDFVSDARIRTQLNSSSAFLNLIGGQFNPAMVDEDCRKLEDYFKSFGYHDIKVSRQLTWEDNFSRVHITFHVEEGQRYRVKSVQVDGAKTVSADQLLNYVNVEQGKYYDNRVVQAGLHNMKNLLGYRGIEAAVDPKLTYYQETAEVAVNYQVQERPPARVGNVFIVGNRVTRDPVIRRQVPLYPGQILTYPDLRRAEGNLARLNIFEMNAEGVRPTVEVLDPDGPNEYKDILVTVEETRTGSLLFGAGINSDAGVTGSIVLNERNFDIFRVPTSWEDLWSGRAFRGAGQEFRMEAVPGNELQRYTISWREPYLFDSQFSLGVSGYYYTRAYLEYDESRLGNRTTVGRRLGDFWSVTGGLRLENVGVGDVFPFAPSDYLSVLGDNFVVGFRGGITYDERDSYLRPTEGQRFDISYEQVGGDFSYPLVTAEANKYFTLYQRPDGSGRHVLALRSQVGFAGSDTPVYDRFFGGGFRSIRGFSFRGVGPQENGFMLGGDFLFLNSVEYQLPIMANDNLYFVTFVDSGTVESDVEINNYRVSAGVGLRIVVPMMGPVPIALDFGFPIVKAKGDIEQIFSFWVGFFN